MEISKGKKYKHRILSAYETTRAGYTLRKESDYARYLDLDLNALYAPSANSDDYSNHLTELISLLTYDPATPAAPLATTGCRCTIRDRNVFMAIVHYLSENAPDAATIDCNELIFEYINKYFGAHIKLKRAELQNSAIVDTGDMRLVQIAGDDKFAGRVYYAPWADRPVYGWETNADVVSIDLGRVNYHNNTIREMGWFKNDDIVDLAKSSGKSNLYVCNCYDCTCEIMIWGIYLQSKYSSGAHGSSNTNTSSLIELMAQLPWFTRRAPHLPIWPLSRRRAEMLSKYPFSTLGAALSSNEYINTLASTSSSDRITASVTALITAGLEGESWNGAELTQINKTIVGRGPFSVIFIPDLDTLKYHSFPKHPPRIVHRIHSGQRKLLLNEVIFMTNYGHLSNTVVYAGAASGIHIPLLSRLFPKHKFILWDPAKFAIMPTDKIEINNDFFTNDVAAKYKRPLFISDIRSGSDTMSFEDFEAEVIRNNDFQRDWLRIMDAPMSMLKFRVPFTVKGDYKYLDGVIYPQPWAPVDSAETRLITDGAKETAYNVSTYEDRMFYLNNIIREFRFYDHDIPTTRILGLCHCFDCAYEIWIWEQYYVKIAKMTDRAAINENIINIMNEATATMGRTMFIEAHGLFGELPMLLKRPHIKKIIKQMKHK